MNYRNRCYKSYVSTKWRYTHRCTKKEYEFFSKSSEKGIKKYYLRLRKVKFWMVPAGQGIFFIFFRAVVIQIPWELTQARNS